MKKILLGILLLSTGSMLMPVQAGYFETVKDTLSFHSVGLQKAAILGAGVGALGLFIQHKRVDRPYLEACWEGEERPVDRLYSNRLDANSLFNQFDEELLEQNKLPEDESFKEIKSSLTHLRNELEEGAAELNDFTVLKDLEWDWQQQRGLLILKHKNMPYVIKFFQETPYGCLRHWGKGHKDYGVTAAFFFMMSGGITRHLSGFTRIYNRRFIKDKIRTSKWKNTLVLPQLYYWVPEEVSQIKLMGHNIGGISKQDVTVPATYAIIANYVEGESLSWFSRKDRNEVLELTNLSESHVDPGLANFKRDKSGKLAILDLEDYRTMFGFKDDLQVKNYPYLFTYFGWKIAKDLVGYITQIKR